MKNWQMAVPHRLSLEEATERVKRLLGETALKHQDKITDLEEQWMGNKASFSFKAKGYKISGTLEVKERVIVLDGTLPWIVARFKGTIESKIREEADKLLG